MGLKGCNQGVSSPGFLLEALGEDLFLPFAASRGSGNPLAHGPISLQPLPPLSHPFLSLMGRSGSFFLRRSLVNTLSPLG